MQDPQSPNLESTQPGQTVRPERHELRYRFECESVEEFGALYAPDVSRGGIFIRTTQVLPLASAVKLELLLADETPFITAEGQVFWTRVADQGSKQGEPGMGIRFTRMSQDSHRTLTRILAIKLAEEGIREAEAEADADEGGAIEEVNTAVATVADLRAAVLKAAVAEEPSDATVVAPVMVASETVKTDLTAPEAAKVEATVPKAAKVEAAASAPVGGEAAVAASGSAPRTLPRPLPALPDWAFVATRFGAKDSVAAKAAADGAVPQHVSDGREGSFGLPAGTGSIASTFAGPSAAAPVPAKAAGRGLHSLRRHPGVQLILGAALVLVTALALAPRQKSPRNAGRARVGAVAAPEVPDARASAAPAVVRPAPLMFGPEPPPSSLAAPAERVISQASAGPRLVSTR